MILEAGASLGELQGRALQLQAMKHCRAVGPGIGHGLSPTTHWQTLDIQLRPVGLQLPQEQNEWAKPVLFSQSPLPRVWMPPHHM